MIEKNFEILKVLVNGLIFNLTEFKEVNFEESHTKGRIIVNGLNPGVLVVCKV